MSKKIWAIDAETDPFLYGRVPVPFAWGAFDGTEFVHFWGEDATFRFANWAAKQDALMFAHNGGRFDFFFLAPFLHEPISIINHRIVKVHLGKAELRDSYAILPTALGSYKKEAIDYEKFEAENREEHKAEILDYLYHDCLYLYDIVTAFFEENPGRPLTLAQAALKSWQTISDRKRPKTSRYYDSQFRPFYYGGRCQAFELGKIDRIYFEMADIHSAYPAAMKEEHPMGPKFRYGVDIEECDFALIDARSYGALPERGPERLLYPNDGEIRRYWATRHEIEAGIETDTLEIVKKIQTWQCHERVSFGDYVDHWFAEKQHYERKGDAAKRHVSKLMLNSLYGKFAQNPDKHMDWTMQSVDDPLPEEYKRAYEFGPHWIIGQPTERLNFLDVATAASITGMVRAQLWRSIQQCEGVLYCDTDSIIATNLRLDFGDTLGQWGHEGTFDVGFFGGRKLYAIGNREKGVTKTASKGSRITFDEIARVAQGETVRWKSDSPTFRIGEEPIFIERDITRREVAG